MAVEIYSKPPKDWDDFVLKHPEGKIYHLSSWNELIRNTFRHDIKYLVYKSNSHLESILPLTEFNSYLFGRYSISLPFINYGGLLSNNEKSNSDQIVNHLNSYRKEGNFNFIELRMDKQIETKLPVKTHKVTFLLDLPDSPDTLWESFKSKLRSQIRRPTKEEMYAVSGGIELLNDFYKIFASNMRDLGTPALPKKFFKNIFTIFPENSKIVCVYSKTKVAVAASFLIHFKEICEIPWASSLSEYNKFSPNMLLYWESLKFAIEQGFGKFDFGRCTPEGGTYRFKKQWGAEEKSLFWYYQLPEGRELPNLNPENPKYKLAIEIWRKTPLFLTNFLGPKIIRNIP